MDVRSTSSWSRDRMPRRRARTILADPTLGLRDMKRVPPSLEDVFVAAVRRAGGVVDG